MSTLLNLTGSLGLYQGTTYNIQLVFSDQDGNIFDLTGYTGSAQIRNTVTDVTPSGSFTCSVIEPPTSGTLQLFSHPSSSTAISGGCYVWDLRLTSGSQVMVTHYGMVNIQSRVTR